MAKFFTLATLVLKREKRPLKKKKAVHPWTALFLTTPKTKLIRLVELLLLAALLEPLQLGLLP
jgi:hypothetical protein